MSRYLTTAGGRDAWHSIAIQTPLGELLEMYGNPVVLRQGGGKVILDSRYWDYSVTTHRYRGQFLGEDTATTRKKLESGQYEEANLTELLGEREYRPS